jgi:predicted N-acetyltransferase YhbS
VIRTFAAEAVPAALADQVRALHREAFGSDDPHDPLLEPVAVLLIDDDQVVASADLLHATIQHAGSSWRLAGLSAVVTAADRRRAGHGEAVVRAAFAHACASGVDLVLFSCDASLVAFYERCGARVLAGSVIVGGTRDDPLRTDTLDKTVLARACSPSAEARIGELEGVEIELHPGAIDRLW